MNITREYNGAKALLTTRGNSFMCRDIRAMIRNNKVVEIIKLTSENERHGDATILLRDIIEEFSEYAIVLKAGPMFDTKQDYINCSNYHERLNDLIRFYTNRGFKSINDIIGYTDAEAMCYNNKVYDLIRKERD